MKTNIILAGALSGLVTAARVDYEAFKAWKDVNELLNYNWGLALWRWFQGAVIGAVTMAGVFEVSA